MGNFTSRPFGQGDDDMEDYKALFDNLGQLILTFPGLVRSTRFVFVPGPADPGAGPCLPRGPLPNVFTKSLREMLPQVTFTSNPCRVRFFTQEIVLFREGKPWPRPTAHDLLHTAYCTRPTAHGLLHTAYFALFRARLPPHHVYTNLHEHTSSHTTHSHTHARHARHARHVRHHTRRIASERLNRPGANDEKKCHPAVAAAAGQ